MSFLCVLSPSLSVTFVCVAGILSLEDALVIILYVSHPPSLSASLFLSAFVSPSLRSSEHLHTRDNKGAPLNTLTEYMYAFPRDTHLFFND